MSKNSGPAPEPRKDGDANCIHNAPAERLREFAPSTSRVSNAAPGAEQDAPGAQPDVETWVLKYDEPAIPDEVFTGHGAAEAAQQRYEQASQNWTVTLLRSVPATKVQPGECPHCAAGMPMSAHEGYHWTGDQNPPKCERQPSECAARKALEELISNKPGYAVLVDPGSDSDPCYEIRVLTPEHKHIPLRDFVRAALSTPCPLEANLEAAKYLYETANQSHQRAQAIISALKAEVKRLAEAREVLKPFADYIVARLEVFSPMSLQAFPELRVSHIRSARDGGKVEATISAEDWKRAAAWLAANGGAVDRTIKQ